MKDGTIIANPTFGFKWVSPQRRGPGSVLGSGVRLNLCNGNGNRPQLVFTLYHDALKYLRWQAQDRIEVGFDLPSGMVAFRRVASGGYCLSRSGGSKGNGPRSNCKIKMTAPDDMISILQSPISVLLDDCIESDGLFVVPLGKGQP